MPQCQVVNRKLTGFLFVALKRFRAALWAMALASLVSAFSIARAMAGHVKKKLHGRVSRLFTVHGYVHGDWEISL